jgi:hypothetical protein
MRLKYLEASLSRYKIFTFYLGFPSDQYESPFDQYKDRLFFRIGIWKFYITFYLWKVTPYKETFEDYDIKRYGITYFEREIHFHWNHTKVVSLPWDWNIVRHDLLLPNGDLYWRNNYTKKNSQEFYWHELIENTKSPYRDMDGIGVQTINYIDFVHYTEDGKIQTAKISLAGEEREWRWKWFKWLPWPRKIQRTVNCNSDTPIGEKVNTWKGGLMGWSCEWRKNETLEEAFYRWYVQWNGR